MKYVKKMPLRYKMQEELLREALKRGKYKSSTELAEVTGMPKYTLLNVAKRCNLSTTDIYDKSTDNERFERIFELLPEANSMKDILTKMGMTKQRFERLIYHMGILDTLKTYFKLKKLNKLLNPKGKQSFNDILISSKSLKDLASKLGRDIRTTKRAFAFMFGDKWDIIQGMLDDYWGRYGKKRKDAFNELNKYKELQK